MLGYEETERARRSLERRIKNALIGAFKPMADFDWKWPSKIDRSAIDDIFLFQFIDEGANVILLGPNGTGKSMVAKNLAHQALLRGYTVRFTTASDMLHELASQETDSSLPRRLRRYCHPDLLVIDEVGYLSYDARYADLLFEVVTRRYEQRAIVVTTNKSSLPPSASANGLCSQLCAHCSSSPLFASRDSMPTTDRSTSTTRTRLFDTIFGQTHRAA